VWLPTAALVVEVVSPDDETWRKLQFYARHGVDEVLIVDPGRRSIEWRALSGDAYDPVERSGVIELGAADVAAQLDWP
jgi:Uma2 family endonuclease